MDYTSLLLSVKQYLRKLHHYRVNYNLRSGKPFDALRVDIQKKALPGIDEEALNYLLQQMYEDGYVIKDDGQTAQFSIDFIFN